MLLPRRAVQYLGKVAPCIRRFGGQSSAPTFVNSDSVLEHVINDPKFKGVDGSWFLPNAPDSALKNYQSERIPRSRFFDMDAIADKASGLPHMLPSEEVCI